MQKTLFAVLLLLSTAFITHAQSKVFKEVGEGISSQMKTIWQDGSLVGYLVFTQLEKASADSFNYRISIMDENLNDIGTINFREGKLLLKAVAFDQDVLCLAYLKSNIIGNEFKNTKAYKRALPDAKNCIFTQFLSLNGKILGSNSINADINFDPTGYTGYSNGVGQGRLKQDIQLRNIPQHGFACFYGDERHNNLLAFDAQGNQLWQKVITDNADAWLLMTSGSDVYLLMKKKDKMVEGGYELIGYDSKDQSAIPRYVLKDKEGNSMRVMSFDNDPVTGKPFLTGQVIDPDHGNTFFTGNHLSRGPYDGVFTVTFNGHRKQDIHEVFSYWDDNSNPAISRKGRFKANKSFVKFENSFRDYQGNTWYAGTAVRKRPNWVGIGLTTITLPTVILPIYFGSLIGIKKVQFRDGMLIKQNAKELSLEPSIPANHNRFRRAGIPFMLYDTRNYYQVSNSDNKTNYMIMDDKKSIIIYNVTQQKTLRTIPHKDGNITTYIYPAKEGHVMISEFNKKEKYTRFSIEAL